jgi:CRP-like cAMP-binding protein
MVEQRITSAFAGLAPAAVTRLMTHSQVVTVETGQFLFAEGEACRSLYVLAGGRVRGYQARADGREQVVWTFDAPGEIFCLVAAFSAARYVFSAQALTAARLYAIDVSTINRLAAEYTSLGLALLAAATKQAAGLVALVESLALRRVPERVARLLRDRALTDGSRRGAGADLDRRRFREDEVASMVGTVRVHVSRTLRGFARDGAVQLSRDVIRIPDLRALERIA